MPLLFCVQIRDLKSEPLIDIRMETLQEKAEAGILEKFTDLQFDDLEFMGIQYNYTPEKEQIIVKYKLPKTAEETTEEIL